jgi:hypothetical protein
MLSGMIFCRCGRSMTTQKIPKWKNRGFYHWYICSSKREYQSTCSNPRMQIEHVEAEVWRQVEEILTDRGALATVLDRAQGRQVDLARQRAAHERLLREAENRAEKLVRELAGFTDPIVTGPLRESLKWLSEVAQKHRLDIADLDKQLQERVAIELGVKALWDLFQKSTSLGEFMDGAERVALEPKPTLTPEEKRKVLLSLGCRVVLDNKKVIVTLEFPLPARSVPLGKKASQRRLAHGKLGE